jgi:hypothetical protein
MGIGYIKTLCLCYIEYKGLEPSENLQILRDPGTTLPEISGDYCIYQIFLKLTAALTFYLGMKYGLTLPNRALKASAISWR